MGKSNTLKSKPERQDGRSHTRGGLDAHDNQVPLAGTGAKTLVNESLAKRPDTVVFLMTPLIKSFLISVVAISVSLLESLTALGVCNWQGGLQNSS